MCSASDEIRFYGQPFEWAAFEHDEPEPNVNSGESPVPAPPHRRFKTLGDWWHGFDRQIHEIYCLEVGERFSVVWAYYEICKKGDGQWRIYVEFLGGEKTQLNPYFNFVSLDRPSQPTEQYPDPDEPEDFPRDAVYRTAEAAFNALCDHYDEFGMEHPVMSPGYIEPDVRRLLDEMRSGNRPKLLKAIRAELARDLRAGLAIL